MPITLETRRLRADLGPIDVFKIAPANESTRIGEELFFEKSQIKIGGCGTKRNCYYFKRI